MSAHEIVVDHPISIKLITPAPPPPTKAEFVTEWRRCEAAGTFHPFGRDAEIDERQQAANPAYALIVCFVGDSSREDFRGRFQS